MTDDIKSFVAAYDSGDIKPYNRVIDSEAVLKASEILLRYKRGKANVDARVVENEEWYRMRHWAYISGEAKKEEVRPSSAWLFNCLCNKHADAMDAFPSPNVLPREESDKGEAQMLSSILPVVLDGCDFEKVYSDVWTDKLVGGTGIYGVYWDKTAARGIGDIVVRETDILTLFWEPGVTDIQASRNVFHCELCDNDTLISQYPKLEGHVGGGTDGIVNRYISDDTIDTTDKSLIVDWYYKKYSNGKTVLHYVKYVNDVVLFATENEPEYAERGLYDHGLYPFVFDSLYQVKDSPAGFGFIDIGKGAQEYIDRGDAVIMKNMLTGARPRYFVRSDGSVNEAEYADMSSDFVHVDGNLGSDTIRPLDNYRLDSIYYTVQQGKIEELKETTGTRDVSTGGTTSGVTAASAIAALQEAGSKLSRDLNKASYRAFRAVCIMVIELIRQFYDVSRQFRIVGNRGEEFFVDYSNVKILPQHQGTEFGVDLGYRMPLFDIEVTAQKSSPYSQMAQNELALSLYNAGFFSHNNADAALACLDAMDFSRKSFVENKIAQNKTIADRLAQLSQISAILAATVDRQNGTNYAGQIAAITGMAVPTEQNAGGYGTGDVDLGTGGESSVTKEARERAAEGAIPK